MGKAGYDLEAARSQEGTMNALVMYWKHDFITTEFTMKKCPRKDAKQPCGMKSVMFTLRLIEQKNPPWKM